ncbi:MAG: TnpV protein [Clostridiales bacterium]|nr:TnpV protein [Clostridiales bacterium]
MDRANLLRKVDNDEGLTVEEIIEYRKIVKPVPHVYGKYGTLAKQYLEEHVVGKYWALGRELSNYLHGIDKAADELSEIMREKLSASEKYKRTGNYMEDVRRINEMQRLIEEEILTELVYVK